MKIIKIVNEKFGQNSYLVVSGLNAVLIDASANVSQVQENMKIVDGEQKLLAILLTHEHFDHIVELDNLVAKYNCPVYISDNGKANLYDEAKNLSIMDKPFKIKEKKLIKTFKDADELNFEDISIHCYKTPGHSMGSSVFVIEDNMFTGDTVFKIDVGRNDLFGGDENVQRITLNRVLNDLSKTCKHFYPGHGASFDKEHLEYNLNAHLGENKWN